MKNPFARLPIYVLAAAAVLLLNSCAGTRLKAIPSPPPTAKLRVYVQPISAPFPFQSGAGAWDSSHKEFATRQISGIEQFLNQTGIYEVVPEQDIKEVLGGQNPLYLEMAQNKWALARQIGKTLYAEYVFVIERRAEPNKMGNADRYFAINLINTSSGKLFEVSARLDIFDNASNERRSAILKKLYSTVFLSAKKDMLETAIKKSENMYSKDKEIASAPKPQASVIQQAPEKQITPPEPKPKALPTPEPKLIAAAPKSEPAKPPNAVPVKPQQEDISGMYKLVIYDLEAPEQYRPVALILTEILREELFLLNRFILVNREHMLDVLREMALQHSGLIDEKQAVKTGKGLAANQVVTGSLGILGKTYFLQAKRIDVETFATLGLASVRFAQGEEEDVLAKLPALAKSLAGMR